MKKQHLSQRTKRLIDASIFDSQSSSNFKYEKGYDEKLFAVKLKDKEQAADVIMFLQKKTTFRNLSIDLASFINKERFYIIISIANSSITGFHNVNDITKAHNVVSGNTEELKYFLCKTFSNWFGVMKCKPKDNPNGWLQSDINCKTEFSRPSSHFKKDASVSTEERIIENNCTFEFDPDISKKIGDIGNVGDKTYFAFAWVQFKFNNLNQCKKMGVELNKKGFQQKRIHFFNALNAEEGLYITINFAQKEYIISEHKNNTLEVIDNVDGQELTVHAAKRIVIARSNKYDKYKDFFKKWADGNVPEPVITIERPVATIIKPDILDVDLIEVCTMIKNTGFEFIMPDITFQEYISKRVLTNPSIAIVIYKDNKFGFRFDHIDEKKTDTKVVKFDNTNKGSWQSYLTSTYVINKRNTNEYTFIDYRPSNFSIFFSGKKQKIVQYQFSSMIEIIAFNRHLENAGLKHDWLKSQVESKENIYEYVVVDFIARTFYMSRSDNFNIKHSRILELKTAMQSVDQIIENLENKLAANCFVPDNGNACVHKGGRRQGKSKDIHDDHSHDALRYITKSLSKDNDLANRINKYMSEWRTFASEVKEAEEAKARSVKLQNDFNKMANEFATLVRESCQLKYSEEVNKAFNDIMNILDISNCATFARQKEEAIEKITKFKAIKYHHDVLTFMMDKWRELLTQGFGIELGCSHYDSDIVQNAIEKAMQIKVDYSELKRLTEQNISLNNAIEVYQKKIDQLESLSSVIDQDDIVKILADLVGVEYDPLMNCIDNIRKIIDELSELKRKKKTAFPEMVIKNLKKEIKNLHDYIEKLEKPVEEENKKDAKKSALYHIINTDLKKGSFLDILRRHIIHKNTNCNPDAITSEMFTCIEQAAQEYSVNELNKYHEQFKQQMK
jgi:hypothetical protein